MRNVTATEANRQFSALLREVVAGETIVVTSHGRPVAKLVPFDETSPDPARERAWQEIFERIERQRGVKLPQQSRDEIDKPDP